MTAGQDMNSTISPRSGWLLPLAVFAVTAVLSAIVLGYYLVPAPISFIEEHPEPTAKTDLVFLSVNGMRLAIPANYIVYRRTRLGGARDDVDLFASLPHFHGYSDANSQEFASDSANSAIVYMLVRATPIGMGETERLQRIYMNFIVDPKGQPGPYGLTEYRFRDDSGYRDQDLFVGAVRGRIAVFRCERAGPRVPGPSCTRDIKLKRTVALAFRFKRDRLADWRNISDGVSALIQTFRTRAR